MLLIVTAQGSVALELAMQILHSTCLSLPVIPVTKAHWPMLPTVLLSQVLTGMQVYVSTRAGTGAMHVQGNIAIYAVHIQRTSVHRRGRSPTMCTIGPHGVS